jgi:D-3-phosphoglycerate dehydrogenase
MQVNFVTSRSPAEAIDRLISESDILSLHLPANAQTHQLLDRRRLNLIRPTAYLINTARGAVVDQTALLQLLQEKRIAGAAIDVFADEPVAGIPSAEIQAIARLDNVIATPHMAYNTQEMSVKLGQELLEVMRSCLAKTPINRVN